MVRAPSLAGKILDIDLLRTEPALAQRVVISNDLPLKTYTASRGASGRETASRDTKAQLLSSGSHRRWPDGEPLSKERGQ